jgi:hypothetical protein
MIGCSRNFHKRCVSDLPDNCSPMARKISDVPCSHDDDVNIIHIDFLVNSNGTRRLYEILRKIRMNFNN